MEEQTDAQLEMLVKIHNQLADLTKVMAEIEMQKTTSEMLKTKLRQLISAAGHIDAGGRSGLAEPSARKVIAPTDTSIQPGEANN